MVKNEKTLRYIKDKSAEIDKLSIGKQAPGFNYPDIDGNMVSLEDLKGSIVYIDVWATWCGPCKAEIPSLKKLENELHHENIKFVSISTDKNKDAWKSMVEAQELGGIQLIAGAGSQILKDYGIMGIPHFIIIDANGNLVDTNAPRPSNPKTKKLLLDLVKNTL